MSGHEHTIDLDQPPGPVRRRTAAAYTAAKWLLGLGLLGAALTLVGTAMQASDLMQFFGPRGAATTSTPLALLWMGGLLRAAGIAAAGLVAYHVLNLLAQIADNTRP